MLRSQLRVLLMLRQDEYSEFIEHLTDNGHNNGLIVIAPHGGNIKNTQMSKRNMFMKQLVHPSVFLHGSAKVLIKQKTVAPLTVGTLLLQISARNHSQSLKRFLGVALSMLLHSMDLMMVMKSPFALEE